MHDLAKALPLDTPSFNYLSIVNEPLPPPIKACYLAGPIDAVTTEEARDWQESVAKKAPDILFFSPAHPYFNAKFKNADVLDRINRAAIDYCECVLAYVPATRTAFGTCREIEYAVAQGYRVLIFAPDGIKSLMSYDLEIADTVLGAALTLRRWAADPTVGPMVYHPAAINPGFKG